MQARGDDGKEGAPWPVLSPPTPTLEAVKKEAKAVLKAHAAGDASACCEVLRHLKQFEGKADANILAGEISLVEVQYALAMDYGFESWAEMKAFVESLETMASGGLPLSDGKSAARWWIDHPENVRMDGGTWIFAGEDVRAEVGGMSWDNYCLSADVWIDPAGPDGTYCVQLTARGTSIYCQLVPGWVLIATVAGEPAGFKHLARQRVVFPDRTWVEFRMKAEGGVVTAGLDGREIVSAQLPCSTKGVPGLLVNQQKNAEVRVRDIRVAFLEPTPEQIAEYGADAVENWEKYVAEHGDRLP
jgi:hypothetical protein